MNVTYPKNIVLNRIRKASYYLGVHQKQVSLTSEIYTNLKLKTENLI